MESGFSRIFSIFFYYLLYTMIRYKICSSQLAKRWGYYCKEIGCTTFYFLKVKGLHFQCESETGVFQWPHPQTNEVVGDAPPSAGQLHRRSPPSYISQALPITFPKCNTVHFQSHHFISLMLQTNHFLHRTLPVPPFHFFDVTDEVVGV
jgi:hypothetical protein